MKTYGDPVTTDHGDDVIVEAAAGSERCWLRISPARAEDASASLDVAAAVAVRDALDAFIDEALAHEIGKGAKQ